MVAPSKEEIIGSQIVTALKWRYATKKFDAQKKISEPHWNILQQSLVYAPSSYGLQPYKFLVIQNKELRQKLSPASFDQPQVTDCSHLVVATYLSTVTEAYVDYYRDRVAEVRGVPRQSLLGFRDMMVGDLVRGPRSQAIPMWAQRQTYISLGFLMSTAALLGIDACPMEGIEPDKYDIILDLKSTEYRSIAVVALGYRHSEDKYQHLAKVRLPENHLVEIR